MAQIIIKAATSPLEGVLPGNRRDMAWKIGDVVELLEDGVHPGKKVVSGSNWDSQPNQNWLVIHVPGVSTTVLLPFKAKGYISVTRPKADGTDREKIVTRTRRLFRVDIASVPWQGRKATMTINQVVGVMRDRETNQAGGVFNNKQPTVIVP